MNKRQREEIKFRQKMVNVRGRTRQETFQKGEIQMFSKTNGRERDDDQKGRKKTADRGKGNKPEKESK